MTDPQFNAAYEEQNKRDYIANATFGSIVSVPLQLSCSVMDYFMYPDSLAQFLPIRIAAALLTVGVLFWFKKSPDTCPPVVFGTTWFFGPLLMVLWMIYVLPDPVSPYYAGLNIILLAMGLISPWTYRQNTAITLFTLAVYIAVAFFRTTPQPVNYVLNNFTFLFLTAAFVILGSRGQARQRLQEFTLRWELDKNRKTVEENNRKLKELDEVKSRFFANLSHELRTPLTLLIAPLESIQNRFSHLFDEDTRGLLQTMHANGLRLLKLINDLLDLVRLESGRLEVKQEPLELGDLVKGLASAVRQVANDKRIKLEASADPSLGTVVGDRDKLEKILLNLLFNALKFTPAEGKVTLTAVRDGEHYVLSVADTGIGIAEKNLPHVFERFWQADGSSKRKFQGVGIGLALVKELSEVQGGSVKVESQEGRGTQFYIRLPYRVASQQAVLSPAIRTEESAKTGAPSASDEPSVTSEEWLTNLYRRAEFFPTPQASGNRRNNETASAPDTSESCPTILVADDEPDMLRFLSSQLRTRYRVLEATDGQQAVNLAMQHLPDIILLDMMMPEKDGMQACREIRAHPACQAIPIVHLTAKADEQTKITSLEAGANDFLAKPFSVTELHVRIKNLVQAHHYQVELSDRNTTLAQTIELLKETEIQLVQSAKMASLGRLSAGIIHEINNPLNFATTGLFALRSAVSLLPAEQRPEFSEILSDVEDGLKRVSGIVSDLRTFTHPDTEQADEVSLKEVVAASLRYLEGEWRDKVTIIEDLSEGHFVRANRNRLVQVLLNLVQNSIDALGEKSFDADKPTITLRSTQADGETFLTIRDNGSGIDPAVRDKIFDPFFTTKDVGKGMGLGLSICYRIIKEYGGRIEVRSEPGQFTEFSLVFPGEQASLLAG